MLLEVERTLNADDFEVDGITPKKVLLYIQGKSRVIQNGKIIIRMEK